MFCPVVMVIVLKDPSAADRGQFLKMTMMMMMMKAKKKKKIMMMMKVKVKKKKKKQKFGGVEIVVIDGMGMQISHHHQCEWPNHHRDHHRDSLDHRDYHRDYLDHHDYLRDHVLSWTLVWVTLAVLDC